MKKKLNNWEKEVKEISSLRLSKMIKEITEVFYIVILSMLCGVIGGILAMIYLRPNLC